MSYPTLSLNPTNIDIEFQSSTIKSEFEKGYVQTRERHTRDRRKFMVSYLIEEADRDLIIAHYQSVRCSTIFTFTDFESATTYNVRYGTPPKYKISGDTAKLYSLSFDLEEV